MGTDHPFTQIPSVSAPEGQQACGLATTSLVLGILSLALCLGPLLGIPAVICGHIALSRIDRSRGALAGRGKAVGGLVTGYVSFVMIFVLAILAGMLLPALSQSREKARRINCSSNLKQIGLAMRMYSNDYNEHFPPSLGLLMKQDYLTVGKVYVCPSTTDADPQDATTVDQQSSYLYFGAGLKEDCGGNDPTKTLIACDKTGNHPKYMNALFADGHVQGFAGDHTAESLAAEKRFYLPPAKAPGP